MRVANPSKRYWRDIRAIRRATKKSTTEARELYRKARKELGFKHRYETTQAKIVEFLIGAEWIEIADLEVNWRELYSTYPEVDFAARVSELGLKTPLEAKVSYSLEVPGREIKEDFEWTVSNPLAYGSRVFKQGRIFMTEWKTSDITWTLHKLYVRQRGLLAEPLPPPPEEFEQEMLGPML